MKNRSDTDTDNTLPSEVHSNWQLDVTTALLWPISPQWWGMPVVSSVVCLANSIEVIGVIGGEGPNANGYSYT